MALVGIKSHSKNISSSLDLKRPGSVVVCISGGNLFQSVGSATEKTLSLQFLHLDLGTSNKSCLGLLKALPGKKLKSQINKVGRGR